MANTAESLFFSDIAELKESLRLGKLIDEDSAAPIFNDGVLQARMQMVSAFEPPMVTRLLAIAPTAAPSSRDQVARMKAQQLEVTLVKYHLFSEMPVQILDRSGDVPDHYAKEAPTRLLDAEEREAELLRLQSVAESLFGDICSWYSVACSTKTSRPSVLSARIGPAEDAPVLGIYQERPQFVRFGGFY